jgi:hypothetical protein
VSEIDVQKRRILPGASSALHGENVNGILSMTSKSLLQVKELLLKFGQTSQKSGWK